MSKLFFGLIFVGAILHQQVFTMLNRSKLHGFNNIDLCERTREVQFLKAINLLYKLNSLSRSELVPFLSDRKSNARKILIAINAGCIENVLEIIESERQFLNLSMVLEKQHYEKVFANMINQKLMQDSFASSCKLPSRRSCDSLDSPTYYNTSDNFLGNDISTETSLVVLRDIFIEVEEFAGKILNKLFPSKL